MTNNPTEESTWIIWALLIITILIWTSGLLLHAEMASEERMWIGVKAQQIANNNTFACGEEQRSKMQADKCTAALNELPFYRYLVPYAYSRQSIRADMDRRMREGCEIQWDGQGDRKLTDKGVPFEEDLIIRINGEVKENG